MSTYYTPYPLVRLEDRIMSDVSKQEIFDHGVCYATRHTLYKNLSSLDTVSRDLPEKSQKMSLTRGSMSV
jgi:hypothetical protein